MHGFRFSASLVVVAAIGLILLFPQSATQAAASEQKAAPSPVVLGSAHDVGTLVRFGTDPAGASTASCGQNVQFRITPGKKLPGFAEAVLDAFVKRKDPNDREGSHTWFLLTRKDISTSGLPPDIDGIRIVLGSTTEAQWWISPTLTTDAGETFSMVLDANAFPAARPIEWLIPLDKFHTSKNEPLTAEKARSIRTISFATSSAGTSLLFDRVTAYRRERIHGWLDFSTSHPTNNLFQRTEPVAFAFTVGGTPPQAASRFRYEVRDYYGKVTSRGSATLAGAHLSMLPPVTFPPGYYEVTAFWTNAAGKDLFPYSSIRAEGSVVDPMGTFAVLPHTIAENRNRSQKLGSSSFFGLHGDFLGLADYIGLTWRFDYTAWVYQEPTKPDRSSPESMGPWAKAAMALPPKPPYRFHIQPFGLNGTPPQWARTDTGKAPGMVWDGALALVRDTVKVEKHLYPHMARRLYGGLWEVDLNDPLYGTQKPPYTPADVADAYRRIQEVVKSEDPDGMVIGPCSSVIRPGWFEDVFKAGVLDWVDGIETHAYCEDSLTPEADDLPGRIRSLNALIRKYHSGKPMPIYVTEAGQPGIRGSDVVSRSQAERMVRASIIKKGEGVRVFLPFYGIDFDRTGYWGFLYNLDIDSPSGPWSTQRTTPKPMVNAMAVCVDMLEGAAPVGRITTPGSGVWAYSFRRGGTTITTLWAPDADRIGRREIALPVYAATVEVADMMGRSTRVKTTNGVVHVVVSEAPIYIVQQ